MIVEDAAESLGATYKGVQTGMFGDYAAISFKEHKNLTAYKLLPGKDIEVA